MEKKHITRKIIFLSIILTFSLTIVSLVGLGEAYRTYPRFKVETTYALNETIKKSIEDFLNAGLPLKQYIGFKTFAAPILESDQTMQEISVINSNGETLFSTMNEKDSGFFSGLKVEKSILQKKEDLFLVDESNDYYHVKIPLKNKFENDAVGFIRISLIKQVIHPFINQAFNHVIFVAAGILLLFILFLIFTIRKNRQKLLIYIGYTLSFLAMSFFIIFTLIAIFSDGIKGKTKGLAEALSARLNAVTVLNLDINDMDGIEGVFNEYKSLNEEIDYIGLKLNDQYVISTDSQLKSGEKGNLNEKYFNYSSKIKDSGQVADIAVNVGIQKKIVLEKVLRSAKNFLVLFVASGFLAFLFLRLILSLNTKIPFKEEEDGYHLHVSNQKLNLIRPLYFLGVFIDAVYTAFLPQFFENVALSNGLSKNLVFSVLFTVFFLAYGLALIPGGKLAERKNGIKSLLNLSILISVIGVLAMFVSTNFYWLIFARIVVGVGQGFLLIAVQYYVLEVVHKKNETQGNSMIVIEFSGGRVAGIAIGALMANYLGYNGVFLIGAIIGGLTMLYGMIFIPNIQMIETKIKDASKMMQGFFTKLKHYFKDREFLKTTLFVGIHSKIVTTGIIIFAIPLFMAKSNYFQEDIGQVMMFYSMGVLIFSQVFSKRIDQSGNTKPYLFFGSIGSALGLLLMGLCSVALFKGMPSTILLISGTLLLGISHGFITAPVITHITNTKCAEIYGKSQTATIYRALERTGQVIGPLLATQIILFSGSNSSVFYVFFIITLVFALIYGMPSRGKKIQTKMQGAK